MVRAFHLVNKVLNFSAERFLRTAGDLFIYDGDYESALIMVDKTLEIDPDDQRALVLKGDILYCLNRDLEALQTFNRVLKLNPASIEAHISRAGVLDILGKFREALDSCKHAFRLMDRSHQYLLPSLYDQVLLLLVRLKKYREARHYLTQAVNTLSEEEADYLMSSYSSLLERYCRTRDQSRDRAASLQLRVINGENAP